MADSNFERVAQMAVMSDDQKARIERFDSLGAKYLGEFKEFETARLYTELRFLEDLRQYHGIYEADVLDSIGPDRSKVFLKKTKVKVDTFRARAGDLLFPANKERNWEIDSTPRPSVPPSVRAEVVKQITATTGRAPAKQDIDNAIREVVKTRAGAMRDLMDDQLTEAGYRGICLDVIFDSGLFGTGLLKGPLFTNKTRKVYEWVEAPAEAPAGRNWLMSIFGIGKKSVEAKGSWQLKTYTEPAMFVTRTPIWRWYPDMAVTRIEDMRACWEHHRIGKHALMDLAKNPSFHGDRIRDYVGRLPLGFIEPRQYESGLREVGGITQGFNREVGQYDLYERWGWVDSEDLEACGLEVGDGSPVFCNVWVLPTGEIIKVVRQPIAGLLYPWHAFYYRKDDTSIFGEGIAKMGRDDQESINAAVRMLLDNAAITAGPMLEVFVDMMDATDDLQTMHPFKIWPRRSGDPQYPAIRAIDLNSHMSELVEIIQLFDANFDETTALPKYLYGDNPTQGAAGTMGGLSMLMGNANISLKDAVIGFDEGITQPFISAVYSMNMQFHPDESVKGDFDVKARGATSLVAKEVRAQQLMQFGASLQPEERQFAKWRDLLDAKASALDLGDFVMTEEEAEAQANSPQAQQQAQMAAAQAQLTMAELQGRVAELQAKVKKLLAEAEQVAGKTIDDKVNAAYAAMQAGGVAAQSPNAAAAGDQILRRAGWTDVAQQQGSSQQPGDSPAQPGAPEQAGGQIPMLKDANTGEERGIETQRLEPAP